MVNFVSFLNGKKFTYSKRDLQNFKDISDRILQSRGKEICKPSKNITSYNRHTFEQICKGESWLADIAIAVLTAKQTATSKAEFIQPIKQPLISGGLIEIRWAINCTMNLELLAIPLDMSMQQIFKFAKYEYF